MANIDSLDIKITASSTNAIRSLRKLSAELGNVSNALNRVNGAPLNNLAQGVNNLSKSINKSSLNQLGNVGKGLKDLNSGMNKTNTYSRKASSGINMFTRSAKASESASKGLASTIGKIYATYWLIFRAFSVFRKAIDYASGLTEVQNVVDKTFGQMAGTFNQFSKDAKESLGMSELTAKEIGSKFQAMGSAMNISSASMKKTDEWVKKINEDFVVANGTASGMSMTLTKLAGDMASFYNKDQKDVAEDLEAIYTGMTRPLRKYGLDLTQATLKEWAMKRGMDADIESMSQAEKTMLRYKYVIENTTSAQGDFANTIDTWANQTRLLKESFIQLGSTIGQIFINAFKPVVKYLNQILNIVNEFAVKVANALGNIFGWQYEGSDVGILGTDGEDFADNMDDASKSAKKIKDYVMGIDELNINNPNSGSGSGAGDSFGGAGESNKKSELGKWTKAYESDIDNLFDLGRKISDTLADALESIDWDSIYEKARGFGKGLADFLNGLITPRLFEDIGTTIANGLNTIIYAIQSFGETFDWKNLGTSLKAMLDGFLANIDIESFIETCKTYGSGIADALNSFLDPVTAENLTKTLAEGLNGIISGIRTFLTDLDAENVGETFAGAVNGWFQNFDFKGLADTLNTFKDDVFNAVKTAIDNIDWKAVWDGIKDFIKALDGSTIALMVGAWLTPLVLSMFKSKVITALNGVLNNITLSVAKVGLKIGLVVVTAIAGFEIGKKLGELFSSEAEKEIYKNFHWTGEGGFFDEVTKDADVTAKAIGEMFRPKNILKDAEEGNYAGAIARNIVLNSNIVTQAVSSFRLIKDGIDDISKSSKNLEQGSGGRGSAVANYVTESANAVEKSKGTFSTNLPKKYIDDINSSAKGIQPAFKDSGVVTKYFKDATNNAKELSPQLQNANNSLKSFGTSAQTTSVNLDKAYGSAKVISGQIKTLTKDTEDNKATFGTWGTSIASAVGVAKDKINEWQTNNKSKRDTEKTDFNEWAETVGNKLANTYNGAKDSIKKWQDDNKLKRDSEKEGFSTWSTDVYENIKKAFDDSAKAIKKWWDEDVAPWFTKEKWVEVLKGIKEGFSEKWNEIENWWKNTAIKKWWDEHVAPWFSKDKWSFSGIKDGLEEAFNNAVKGMKEIYNKFAKWINEKLELSWDSLNIMGQEVIPSGKIQLAKLPTFATGGFPEDGLFMANHGELVGQFSNGSTAVANNEQIVEGIKYGVAEAVISTLGGYMEVLVSTNTQIANKDTSFSIDGRELVNAYNTRASRNGYSFT